MELWLRLLSAPARIPAGTRVAEAVDEIHSWTLGQRLLLLLPRQLVGELLNRWRLGFRTVGLLMLRWQRCESSESSRSLRRGSSGSLQSLSSDFRLKLEEN